MEEEGEWVALTLVYNLLYPLVRGGGGVDR